MHSLPLALFALAPQAHAVIYVGNPEIEFHVTRPAQDYVDGSVDLDTVRVWHCAGGYTDYSVGATIDPVAGTTVAIGAGDHCAITLFWGSAMDIDGSGYTVEYDESSTKFDLADPISPVALSPYSVVSGSMSGGGPWLVANIE